MGSIFSLRNKMLETPEFIPSLTSVKTCFNYLNLLDFLSNQSISHYMISAYDLYLYKDKVSDMSFVNPEERNTIFFMDSGAFEIHNNITSIKWNDDLLINTALNFNPDILISLDYISSENKVNLNKELENYEFIRKKLKDSNQFYSLVMHPTKTKDVSKFLNDLNIDKKLFSICIPERNLGFSFTKRIEKLKEIIKVIKDDYCFDQLLVHLMGCSYPSSIIKYANLGIELFDGIHWQDMLYNPINNEFTDFSNLIDVNCKCKYCNEFKNNINKSENFLEKYYMYYALSHNLYNYKLLMKKIRKEMK
ncbi:MAG: hypothetical protein ACFFDF_17840 [Candidatus Odinarchaeota archaeon]